MNRHFMRGTPLAGLEREMMRPPGYRPRGGGMQVCRDLEDDFGCVCCLKIFESQERKKDMRDCSETARCLMARCRTPGELIRRLADDAGDRRLSGRTRDIYSNNTGSIYQNEAHRQKLRLITAMQTKGSKSFTAAVFLLSADPCLFSRAVEAIEDGHIDFSGIDVRNIGIRSYTLLYVAKDLYHGKNRITASELCDSELVSDEMFRLIMSAYVIRRYGLPDCMPEEGSRGRTGKTNRLPVH